MSWQRESIVTIREGDEYRYNSAVRPGIPSLSALTIVMAGSDDYFSFKFISVYYYFLLLGLFLFVVVELSKRLKQDTHMAIFYGVLFYTFSWTLARSYIFNSKEIIIYFLLILSLYLTYRLIELGKRSTHLEFLLGVSIGLNAFVNLHGIIIGVFLFLILILFSSLQWKDRIRQCVFIFLMQLFFGAFEFIGMFGFIFSKNLNAIKDFLTNTFVYIKKSLIVIDTPKISISDPIPELSISNSKEAVSNIQDKGHQSLYQVSNIRDLYLKAKFQILTNVGVFGFYFWFFLGVCIFCWKKIFCSSLGKIIVIFMFTYFLIIIDPFGLNRHRYAIILSGSPKYASLILFLSLIFVSVYADYFLKKGISFF